MKLRPVIKTEDSKNHLVPWVIERFPENYREMTYLEPFAGGAGVLLNKERSSEEVINDLDRGIASAWMAVRDEPKTLISKLRKINCTEKTFKSHLSKNNSGDYMAEAVSEFVLRYMSRGGHKDSFYQRDNSGEHFLEQVIQRIREVSERMEGVYVLNRDAMSIIRAFSHENSLVYCDPPSLEDMDADKHMELGGLLNEFKGKVVVTARNSALYKRIYSGWTRKGVPGRPKESAWFNF